MLDHNQYNDVTKSNIQAAYPICKSLLSDATFIALDTEFSGLGTKDTRAQNIEERYHAFKELAKSHSLLAVGLSTFKRTELPTDETSIPAAEEPSKAHRNKSKKRKRAEKGDGSVDYVVNNFSFTLFRETDYTVSPSSLKFLCDSGFDFHKQISDGIPFYPGEDEDRTKRYDKGKGGAKSTTTPPTVTTNSCDAMMRSLLLAISSSNVPLVVHNGFLDLIYLYHSFFGDLPEKLAVFLADLTIMFPGGIYDTKYIADYHSREKSSFLAYLHKKYERENNSKMERNEMNRIYCDITPRCELPHSSFDYSTKKRRASKDDGLPYCVHYALHGFCKVAGRCGKSHDLDIILDHEDMKAGKLVKNPEKSDDAVIAPDMETSTETPTISNPEQIPSMWSTHRPGPLDNLNAHSAPLDAFMTGFVFAYQTAHFGWNDGAPLARNKMYLVGKSVPLIVEKSQYAKYSEAASRKIGQGRT